MFMFRLLVCFVFLRVFHFLSVAIITRRPVDSREVLCSTAVLSFFIILFQFKKTHHFITECNGDI